MNIEETKKERDILNSGDLDEYGAETLARLDGIIEGYEAKEEELKGALIIPKGWYLKEGDWRIREYKRATHTESKDDGRLSRYTVSLYNDNNQQVKGESDWFDAWSESGRKYSTQALRNALEQIKR